MPIALGTSFETALLTAAGIDPTTIDPGSVSVTYLNPGGNSTVRATLVLSVDTSIITNAIRDSLPNT